VHCFIKEYKRSNTKTGRERREIHIKQTNHMCLHLKHLTYAMYVLIPLTVMYILHYHVYIQQNNKHTRDNFLAINYILVIILERVETSGITISVTKLRLIGSYVRKWSVNLNQSYKTDL